MIVVPAGDEVRDELRRGAVREGEEDRIRGRKLRVDVEVERGQMRVDAGDRIAVAAAAHEPDQLDIRMSRQEPNQLATDISGRPDDPDPDHARGRVASRHVPGDLGRRHWTYDYTRPMHSHATERRPPG